MSNREIYIKRCIQLAQNGLGRTYPNPIVGSVIVNKGVIIGEGWHHKSGEAHAEVNAVKAVRQKELLSTATIYVSLEPCSHYGKTPPCTNLIIDSGIKRVVIGTVDPFAKVTGKGIKKLMEAGCEVSVGILEKECRDLNKRFFTYHLEKRPYIILKWAQSSDNYLGPSPEKDAERKPLWITNQYSRQLVHKWRTEEQAILVGTNTVVADNPKLDARHWQGENPIRVVLDRTLRIPADSNLFDNSIKTLVLTEESAEKRGAKNVIFEQVDFKKDLPQQVSAILYRHEIQSVIIEGGRQTLQSFIDLGMWDEARVFTGKVTLGSGIKAPEFSGKIKSETSIEQDQLKIYLND